MAQFTLTSSAQVNQPPSQVGDKTFNVVYDPMDAEIIFKTVDFTQDTIPQYSDPEGDAPYKLKILTLPINGELTYDGGPVTEDDEILFTDIDLELFKYNSVDLSADYTDSFTFEVSDVGSEQFTGTGTITINVSEKINKPPIIGDGSDTIEYGETKVFTSADFTSLTTPAYTDPESDAAAQLKILSLPVKGTLYFNGIPVIVNQIISFADIASGLFTQVGDISDKTLYNMVFTYAIADAGSGIFVE